MGYESIESLEFTEEIKEAADMGEVKLSGFQNDVFVDNPMHKDLMPKIRFTTDANEAAEAAGVDRSNPFDLPDSVFYVKPKETTQGDSEKKNAVSSFQNDRFDIDVSDQKFRNEPLDIKVTPQEIENVTNVSSGEYYVGPSSAELDIKIESATRSLTLAQERLAETIADGGNVLTAQRVVEDAQKLLDTYTKMYNTAVNAEARQAAGLMGGISDVQDGVRGELDTKVKFGNLAVDHAQFELENAYNSGNKIRIQNAERNLAHEKAKEAAKK